MNNLFDHIYVLYINKTELYNITKKLSYYNINFEPFLGVNGKNIRNPTNLSSGAYGHSQSFILIIKDAIKNNYKNILILEPDIYLSSTPLPTPLSLPPYKLLYLGASQDKFYNENTWESITLAPFYHAYKTLGTFALAIDQTIYQEVINAIDFKTPTDVCLTNLQETYKSDCYVIYPNIICCDTVKSTTSTRPPINQLESMKKYKWTLKYDIINWYSFEVRRLVKNNLIIKINSFMDNYKIIIDGKVHVPNKCYFINMWFVPVNKTVDIKLEGIFIEDIMVKL